MVFSGREKLEGGTLDVSLSRASELYDRLSASEEGSLDLVVIVSGYLLVERRLAAKSLFKHLEQAIRALKPGGLLFVQGFPVQLSSIGAYLSNIATFRYWIALESMELRDSSGLPTAHAGLLLFTKGSRSFRVRKTRFSHRRCIVCQNTLKDWGGKAHLMHPEGYVISDVWKDLPKADNYTRLSKDVLDTIFRMIPFSSMVKAVIGPREGFEESDKLEKCAALPEPLQLVKSPLRSVKHKRVSRLKSDMVNRVCCGDILEVLGGYPESSIDLAFADPPYNLNKLYSAYEDGQEDQEYISWCNAWLGEYARILKPKGALFVLNLPKWALYHADFLNRHLYFQNWIVWEALSEPRGKLMPAHYALLYYTKSKNEFTLNLDQSTDLDSRDYCLRQSCIRKRKKAGKDKKEHLTDIWWDIHRIKHQRDRDYHPCQLPRSFMERIIRLCTNVGDVVLDGFCGTGTTAVVSVKLGRRYVAVDMDPEYAQMAEKKIAEVTENGFVARNSVKSSEERSRQLVSPRA